VGRPSAARAIPLALAALWLFVAWAFHYRRYATINWAAQYFAVAFVAQALLLAWSGVAGRIRFGGVAAWRQRAAVCVVAAALFGVPLLERLAGRGWSQLEAFGTAPDPTAIGTLGILLLARDPSPWPAADDSTRVVRSERGIPVDARPRRRARAAAHCASGTGTAGCVAATVQPLRPSAR
jgi:hypothetical protein